MVRFTKMHGLGNDFVVFDAINQSLNLTPSLIRGIADRHFGVGCDQVLLVESPTQPNVDFRYRIFNADGGEVEQCGNGARCFVQFVRDHGLTDKTQIRVETLAGIIEPRVEPDGRVSVNMGAPRFEPAEIPFVAERAAPTYPLELGEETVQVSVLSMGNPHAVQVVEDVSHAPVAHQGRQVECHDRFPRRVNAGFMEIVDRRHIKLRVWERGAGETLACGSGACAAVVAAHQLGEVENTVDVLLPGGHLEITWAGDGNPVWLTGPASSVFEGTIDLDHLSVLD